MRTASRLCALALLLGVAGACRLDPAFQRPDPGTPERWREAMQDERIQANLRWFDLFQDEVLRELIRTAVAENHDLEAALARIEEARALVQVTGSALYPSVDLGASAGGFRDSREGSPPRPEPEDVTYASHRLALEAVWEADVFGRVRSATAAQRAAYLASLDAYQDVGLSLVSAVGLAYFELRALDAQIQSARRNLVSCQEYVDLARVLFEGGKTSELDLRQAESEYYRTQVIHLDLLRLATVQENAISVLVGRAPGAVPRGLELQVQPLPPNVPAGLPSDLVSRRPDIRAQEQAVRAETALVGAARANLYPRFPLTASYGFESAELTNWLTAPAQAASIVAGIVQPIFNAGRNRALVAAQCARLRAAAETYAQDLLVAFQEVEDGLVSYRRYAEQRAAQRQRLQALRRVMDLAETRYRGGVTSYLEVLDSQRQLFDAELEESRTVAAQLASLVFLFKALGGTWEDAGTPARACVPVAGTVRTATPVRAPAPGGPGLAAPPPPPPSPPLPPSPPSDR